MRRWAALVLAASAARAGVAVLRATAPGGAPRWQRTNHTGRTVTLYAGPGATLGTVLAAGRSCPAAGLAILAGGMCGAYDDIAGADDPKRGFRAHLAALRDGDVTSGAVKLFGISTAGLVAGALLKERALDKVLAGVVIAGAAHMVNLVDVRPGRAVCATLALALPGMLREGAAGEVAAATAGAVLAVLTDDLAERTMLGDTGAHALGAALGCAAVLAHGRAGLVAHAAAVVAAAVHGDRVSEVARSPVWG
ncbi:hypothetical protein [Streptomyces sp. MA5143a]|uniref:hypothetical protein n=1 Tax=Streptomyces sp. MA5143a TaxID=2083010 RepID=UPI000D1B9445|nr:hypothetical protein [Streptomyces sp. MA5143a]SPF01508.1 hypothetical protein SMA5143A_2239 [Streptomyces sp. MA5143a]